MFEDNISRCGDSDRCPYKDSCRRATPRPVGIYTISYFYKDCFDLKNEYCEFYIEKKENKYVK